MRDATPGDLGRLLELYADLDREMGEYRGRWAHIDTWPEPVAGALGAAIADEQIGVFVGTIDDYPVGYAVCEIEDALPQTGGERVGNVRDLFVEPEAREVGVGEALLLRVIDWLTEHGVRSADITVSPGHRAAKNFCEENGFVARSITMHSQW